MTIYRYGTQKYIQLAIWLFIFYCGYVNLSAADLSSGFKLVMAVIFLWQLYRIATNIQISSEQLKYRFFGITYKVINLSGVDFQAPKLRKTAKAKPLGFFRNYYEIGFYEGDYHVHQLILYTNFKKAEQVFKYLKN